MMISDRKWPGGSGSTVDGDAAVSEGGLKSREEPLDGELTIEQLARFYYKYPLNGFPILDDAYKFSGLLLRRYVLNNMAEFKAARTPVRYVIEKHVYYPSEGEILRMIFGEKRIQEFPVLHRKGSLMGIWELSSFFRIFDRLPFSAYLNFQKIFDLFPRPVFVLDENRKLMSFNRAMARFAALEQDDTRLIGRKIDAVLRDLGWRLPVGNGIDDILLFNGIAEFRTELFFVKMENGRRLAVHIIGLPLETAEHGALFSVPLNSSLPEAVNILEKKMIKQALDDCGGSLSKASLRLGIPRQTLFIKAGIYRLISQD